MFRDRDELLLRLKSIIDTAIDGIITIDTRGNIESMNPSALTLFGYEIDDVIGNNISMLMPEPYHSEHDGYIERYQQTKKPRIIGIGREVKGKTKTGRIFPMRLAVSKMEIGNEMYYTGIIHDLSDIKNAQDQILVLNKKLEEKVEERTYELEKVVNKLLTTNNELTKEIKERKSIAQKLRESESVLKEALEKEKELSELKSRFVAMASHEFRTPLTTIKSSASLIGKYHKEDQQDNREKHIERIKSAVSNLTGILNDFLSLSKLEEGKIEVNFSSLNIAELIEEVIEDLKGGIKENQEIVISAQGEPFELETDKRILRNILYNLLSNSIKYSEDNIQCKINFGEQIMKLVVEDKGIGIPEADQKYLFTRFFRAGNVTNIQGTGLGLNIVKRYVELLHGEIEFKSEQEMGTTFSVVLPRTLK